MSIKVPPGLIYHEKYITNKDEEKYIQFINKQKWNRTLTRLTQHYGYKYNYKNKTINKVKDKVNPIPEIFNTLIEKLINDKLIDRKPDQLIINRYLPGEGISEHIDSISAFDDNIISVSLGSSCGFVFSKADDSDDSDDSSTEDNYDDVYNVYLKRKTLIIMKGKSRYNYKHSIKPVKQDMIKGKLIDRGIRYSLTFRFMN